MTTHFQTVPGIDADEIAVTAVKDFCMRPRPVRTDMAKLVDLVLPMLPAMTSQARRTIAAALGASRFAPKQLLRALCDYPVSECASVLTRSELLNDAELLAILSQNGTEHARAIARRRNLAFATLTALRALHDDGVDRALDLRQRAPIPAEEIRFESLTSEPEASSERMPSDMKEQEPAKPAKEAYERIQSALGKAPADYARPLRKIELDDLIDLASDENPVLLHTAIGDSLGITLFSAAALCANPSSKNLLLMLRFLEASTPKAFEFFATIAPDTASKRGVPARFTEVYETISMEDAAAKVRSWRSDDLIALAREALSANQPGSAQSEAATAQDNIEKDRRVA